MGNVTNSRKWGGRERLAFIETLAYWRGWIRRGDISARFGLSTPQASADLAEYQRLHPANLTYDKSQKRYVAARGMVPAIVPPKFEDALSILKGADGAVADRVATIDLPQHHVPMQQAREILRAVLSGSPVDVYYFSVNSGTEKWRTIAPHAFAHDGYRWHVRGFCMESKAHRDFVLGRITKVREATAGGLVVPVDKEWSQWITVKFRAFPDLKQAQQAAIEKDFGMKRGVGSLRVRRAMLHYTLVYLGMHPQPERFNRLALIGPLPT